MPQLTYQPTPLYGRPSQPKVALQPVKPRENRSLLAIRLLITALIISGSIIGGVYVAKARTSNKVAVISPVTTTQSAKPQVSVTPGQSAGDAPISAPASVTPQATEPDSAALQAVLDKWQQDNSGSQFSVVMQELGGQKRSASLQPNTVFGSASLYKLYLAQFVYSKIDQGKLSLDDTLGMPYTVSTCIQRMIVISDNTCGEGLANALGWANFNNFVRASGFTQTVVSPVNTTTANDVSKFLLQLQSSSLMSSTSTLSLLSYMNGQLLRSAIPAGVPGVSVADKVGYINNIWNDAAIVYHPKGNYILVVLSTNSGPSAIADLSHRISDFMNQ